MLWLAGHTDTARSTPQIARVTRVPAGYLSKVLQSLARAGLVVSQPGRGGGFALTRPARLISVLDVVNAVDPIRRIESCPLGLTAHRDGLCPLHQRLDRALALVQDAFARSSIADLLAEPSPCRPLYDDVATGRPARARVRAGRKRKSARPAAAANARRRYTHE